MATYPGMSLNGEVRESVSLDEDDLSDVEDEVFIRDGKSGYKFAEDVGLKRPLMAPRRKIGRNDFSSRFKARPPCKALCKPCCYIIGALTVLLGLIIIVVILVSMFPLPIDKIRNWIVSKTSENLVEEILPCADLNVTDIWTVSFPKFISESPIRTVDVNKDNIDDILFGFGTALDNTLHPDIFCPMFMGVSPPCEGGVIAINGLDGQVLWKKWLTHTVFGLICSYDINGDGIRDCLVNGKAGIFCVINSADGSLIWQFEDKDNPENLAMDIYWPTFIPDQDGDKVPDILASHILQTERSRLGHLLIVSGKTGSLVSKVSTPNNSETYCTPQLLNNDTVIFGTGSPISPGNLYVTSLQNISSGNLTVKSLYEDKYKGILAPSILVDITGDGVIDIISAMFNTTIIAFDGKSMRQLWNFTIPNSETLSVPIPAHFNNDNVTDFLVKYQTGIDFPTYFYSQTYIIDGKTGKEIEHNPIIDTVGYQMGGLALEMERHGFDMFLYWLMDCKNFEGRQDKFQFKSGSAIKKENNADMCLLRFNTSTVAKLYALNQFEQPPGIEIYNSDDKMFVEYNNTKNPVDEAANYVKSHPNSILSDNSNNPSNVMNELDPNSENFRTVKYKGGSSFRHKGSNQGLIRDFSRIDARKKAENVDNPKFEDYDQSVNWQGKNPNYGEPIMTEDIENDFNNYFDENERNNLYNQNNQFPISDQPKNVNNNRDPRSKYDTTQSTQIIENVADTQKNDNDELTTISSTDDKNSYGIYDYKNIYNARNSLLHNLNNVPSEILRETFFKNRERQLRKSKFEQRDITAHKDKLKDNDEVRKILEKEKKESYNKSGLHLWDLESEKELIEKGNYYRRKRTSIETDKIRGIPKLTSVGVLLDPINSTVNAIDLVFITYWLPVKSNVQILTENDLRCVEEKLKEALNAKGANADFDKNALKDAFENECLNERGAFYRPFTKANNNGSPRNLPPYYNEVSQMRMGQLTLYRIRLKCRCVTHKKGDRCAKFLPISKQKWPSNLGRFGDGVF